MKNVMVVMALMVGAQAGELPSPPQPKIVEQVVMWGSSAILAQATKYGSEQCRREGIREGRPQLFGRSAIVGGQLHPYRHAFKATVPADAATTIVALVFRRHEWARSWLPGLVTGAQLGIAGNQFAGGCY